MIDDEHQRAQQLAAEADRNGDARRARELFTAAAALEASAFRRVPSKKRRTAGNFDQAEDVCRDLLINRELLPTARAELLDILAAIPRPCV